MQKENAVKGKGTLIPKGFAGKIIKSFIIFALVMGVIYLAMFAIQLSTLHIKLRADEKAQLSVVAGRSEESMTAITEENLTALIKWASDRTDDEFWIAAHNLKIFQRQVADIFRHPEYFGRRPVYPPLIENAGKPALQFLCPGDYENLTPDEMDMIERLANTEPMLKEFLISNDFNVDIGVATMDGLCLDMDRLSEKKITEDGKPISLDVSDQDWYTGAIARGNVFFYPIHSLIYDFDEVAYAAPVYVDDELVAVIEGSIQMDLLRSFLKDRDLGESGFTVLISDKGQLACSPRTSGELKIAEDFSLDIRDSVNEQLRETINKGLSGETGVTKVTVDGEEYYAAYGYMRSCGWIQIMFVSVDEVMNPTNALLDDMRKISRQDILEQEKVFKRSGVIAGIVFLIILGIGIVAVSEAARKRARPIALMAERVRNIGGDNISFEMDESYKTGDEIQILAENFEESLKKSTDYVSELLAITSEKERVNTELALATRIQTDMLPSKFPAFPDRTDFDLYGSMNPAREVGGDFYDFYLIDDDHLCMVIADVAGKGIPAALFMMASQISIANRVRMGLSPGRALESSNDAFIQRSRGELFVTIWLGILELSTGKLIAANAGHEYPVIKHGNGQYELFKDPHSFVVGGMEGIHYKEYELQLEPGSKLFLYTDGVPEATDTNEQLFGTERMLSVLNQDISASPEQTLKNMTEAIDAFVGEAEQFDDVTMLCVEYKGINTAGREDL